MNENDFNSIIIDLGEQLGQAAIDRAVLKVQNTVAVRELNESRAKIAELEAQLEPAVSNEAEDAE